MKPSETFYVAFKALAQNKARTFLTTLGVIIGVFSVVALVSLVQGIKNFVTDQFDAMGSNLLFVYPGSGNAITDDPAKFFSNNKLDQKHIDLIEKYTKSYIEDVTPLVATGKVANYKTRNFYASVTGVNQRYQKIGDVEMTAGRFFTSVEEKSKARVAVLGPLVEKDLFKGINSIGRKIKIDNKSFLVIGVMEEKGPDYDEMVIIPATTIKSVLNIKNLTAIEIKLKKDIDVDLASKEIEIAMMRDLKKDEFTIFSQADLLTTVESILGVLTLGLGAVSGISLVVGGIGIMNIMLVSVTERIKEIGLRKALGATSFNIGFQFMIESIAVSLVGGILGLILGWASTFAVKQWINAEVPLWTIALAFGFSVFVGAVFGTYPAVKASKLDPIEALRYE